MHISISCEEFHKSLRCSFNLFKYQTVIVGGHPKTMWSNFWALLAPPPPLSLLLNKAYEIYDHFALDCTRGL